MGLIQTLSHIAPEPKPEVEERLRKRLKDYDSLLDIKWVENVVFNEQWQKFEGRYALVCYWDGNDPRRAMVKSGEISSDYDILGWFGENPQDATIPSDPEKFWNRIMDVVASADNSRTPAKERLRAVGERNKRLREQKKKDFLEGFVHDQASYYREKNLGNTIVNVPKEIK